MKLKTAPASFKAAGDTTADEPAGTLEAIVSVFGNIDSWGDVVLPGAFTDTVTEWKNSPNSLPVLWSHRMDDPTYNIGEVIDLREFGPGDADIPDWVDPFVRDNGGLWVKGVIDTGIDASPIAIQGLRLLKSRRVTQFSYAFDEIDAGWETVGGVEAWALKKLKLYEVSPTQVGANELTSLLAAKAARTFDGNDATRAKDTRTEPDGVTRQDPGMSPASVRLLSDLAALEAQVAT